MGKGNGLRGAGRTVGALPYREDVLTISGICFAAAYPVESHFAGESREPEENIRKVMDGGRFDRVMAAGRHYGFIWRRQDNALNYE